MHPLSDTVDGRAPIVGVRLAAETRERVIELAGDGRGALSDFVRRAVEREIERAGTGPPGQGT